MEAKQEGMRMWSTLPRPVRPVEICALLALNVFTGTVVSVCLHEARQVWSRGGEVSDGFLLISIFASALIVLATACVDALAIRSFYRANVRGIQVFIYQNPANGRLVMTEELPKGAPGLEYDERQQDFPKNVVLQIRVGGYRRICKVWGTYIAKFWQVESWNGQRLTIIDRYGFKLSADYGRQGHAWEALLRLMGSESSVHRIVENLERLKVNDLAQAQKLALQEAELITLRFENTNLNLRVGNNQELLQLNAQYRAQRDLLGKGLYALLARISRRTGSGHLRAVQEKLEKLLGSLPEELQKDLKADSHLEQIVGISASDEDWPPCSASPDSLAPLSQALIPHPPNHRLGIFCIYALTKGDDVLYLGKISPKHDYIHQQPMSGTKDFIVVKGTIEEALPATTFRVKLENGQSILCHLAGKLRMNRIRLTPGDEVEVELSPYDLTKGRITYRL